MRLTLFAPLIAIAAVLGVSGCGGGSGSSGVAGGLTFQALWQQGSGSTTAALSQQGDGCPGFEATDPIPEAVNTVRVVFKSSASSGDGVSACCVAVRQGSAAFNSRHLVLTGLRAGPAMFSIAGSHDTSVSDDGVGGVECPTEPDDAGELCSGQARPTEYDSGPIGVTIIPGLRTNADSVCVRQIVFPTATATPSPTNTVTNTATPTLTPTSSPSPTPTGTPTATPSPTSTATNTPTPSPTPTEVVIHIGSARGLPGARVQFSVTINTAGKQVIGTQNVINFNPLAQIAFTPSDGQPDCSGAISAMTFLPLDCTPGQTCEGIRPITFAATTVIPDGSVLYICNVNISPDASPTNPTHRYPLTCSAATYVDNTENEFPAVCTDGEIVVEASALP